MSGFKLLAIRALKGCDDSFLNNLKEGVVYKFYQDYKFSDKTGTEVLLKHDNLNTNNLIVKTPEDVMDIFSSSEVNINVSAVVGKNGSGKSSLIDFHNAINYYLACYHFNTMDTTMKYALDDIKILLNLSIEYIDSLFTFLGNKFSEAKKDISNSGDNAILEITQLVINHLDEISLTKFNKIEGLKIDKKNELLKLCIRYSTEGTERVGLKKSTSTLGESLFFQELNSSFIGRFKHLIRIYQKEKEFDENLRENFNFQLYYSKSENVHCIEKINDDLIVPDYQFYYSILLNYSLHSLNSNHMGNWIFNLFHKNDGYQTPIVINPYRNNGIIDINKEVKLSVDRLTYNIIDQLNHNGSATILNKYHFSKFLLKKKVNDDYRYPFKELEIDFKNQNEVIDFVSTYPTKFHNYNEGKNILDYGIGYLIQKFRKIGNTYMEHFYNYGDRPAETIEKKVDNLEKWIQEKSKLFVKSNDTHITKKFFQTYNFLKNYDLYSNELAFIKEWDLEKEIEVNHEELIAWIELIKSNILDVDDENNFASTDHINSNLFPNIFNIDIEFKHNGKPIKLSDMSSGEQQYIFNLNTITYHINNLKSISEIQDEDNKLRRYDEVNLILDEIELYYHPQFQKKFVKDVLDSIKELKSLGALTNFNIIFLTHSPFILSDIPSSNILRLDDGQPNASNELQTFGANIHDLLAHDFFLGDGFMGEFAKGEIDSLIDFLKSDKNSKKWDDINSLNTINLIGEDLVKQILLDLYYIKFRNKIDQQIEHLKSLKKYK